ncbi:hypothetical protein ACI3E1_02895 [Ligilactobacillus sp. LYQ139]|uniref:hypothetical protein n=1 Tax=Ligilactobacillus sp. LYQ139 TaxID=3378800 RepID=UPI00385238A9
MHSVVHNKKRSSLFKLLLIVCIILLLTWSLRLNLANTDETYSLELIKHSFWDVIQLDALDVHPPLYYLVLKLLFKVTFISHCSPFIQIVAGRLFSVGCFFLTILILNSLISSLLNRHTSPFVLVLTLLMPSVLWYSTNIRMYALAALFISCELFFIYQFETIGNYSFIICATIFAGAAAWTHYFAAVSAGLLFMVFWFYALFHSHCFKKVWAYTIAGIGLIVLFIPWLTIAYSQLKSVHGNYWIKNSLYDYIGTFYYVHLADVVGLHVFSILAVLFLIVLAFVLTRGIKLLNNSAFNLYFMAISGTMLGTIGLGFLISILMRPIFVPRYVYPIFFPFICFSVPLITLYFQQQPKFNGKVLIALAALGVLTNTVKGVHGLKEDITAVRTVNIDKSFKATVKCNRDTDAQTLFLAYCLPKHRITTTQYKIRTRTVQSEKLFDETFPNVVTHK